MNAPQTLAPRIYPMDAAPPSMMRFGAPMRLQARSLGADLCYLALRLSGWLAVSVSATLGLYVLFFLALGDMGADGFFAQLANLANRYGAAEETRRAAFLAQVCTVSAVLFAGVATARYRSLLAIFTDLASARKDRP